MIEEDTSAEQVLAALREGPTRGVGFAQLAGMLHLSHGPARDALGDRLRDLMSAGQVARRQGRYLPADQAGEGEQVVGVLHVSPHGVGYVDRGEAFDDVKVAPHDVGPTLDGDTVRVIVWPGRGRDEGQVLEVVSRGRARVTGDLRRLPNGTVAVEPDDPRLPAPIPVTDWGPAREGQAVLCRIERYPEAPGRPPVVVVEKVLGEPGVLVTEVAKCVAGAGVEDRFPAAVERQATDLRLELDAEEYDRRVDLREVSFVTIDPATARDFDDAVALEPGPDGRIRLWVAVADVSHFVAEGSALDVEARRRGCSLYLPDRAIHMLPEALSAGVCSLVPHEDRLAMVVRLDIDPGGAVQDEACMAAVIHSRGRLDYGGVAAALSGDFRGKREAYREHIDLLERLHTATRALHRARIRRGSLDLDLPESQVVLDQDDPSRVRDVRHARPDEPVKLAYRVIEELMIAANEAVGRRFLRAGARAVWRVHPRPEPAALLRLSEWMESYGVAADPDELAGRRGLARLLGRLDGHRAQRPLTYLVLRTLKQAIYGAGKPGHFGLASDAYLHFTSPIRRYPDLHVHRLLKRLLAREGVPAGRPVRVEQTGHEALMAVARESTLAERRAVEVEREVARLYGAAFMRDRVGDRTGALVVGLTDSGLFAALDWPAVEGMVRLESLGDGPFELDTGRLRLLDLGRGRVYSLGDRLEVEVRDASVRQRRITLSPVGDGGAHQADPEVRMASWVRDHARREAGRQARRGDRARQGGRSRRDRSDPRGRGRGRQGSSRGKRGRR